MKNELMKVCHNCNIHVGGSIKTCPLCQNKLTGECGENNWPPIPKLKTRALQYKIQLFVVLAAIVISLLLDFRTGLNTGKHWSLMVAMWGLTIEWLIRDSINKTVVVSKTVTVTVLLAALLLGITSWFFCFTEPILYFVIPIMISCAIVANFVFSIVDKKANALVYLFSNLLIGIIPYIVLSISEHDEMLPWTICVMITILAFLGIVIFRGSEVLHEVQKRMNF